MLSLLLIFAGAVALAVVVATLATSGSKSDDAERKGSTGYPEAVDRLEPGQADRASVREALGRPNSVEPRGRSACWYYRDLAASSTAYRFCFEGETLSYRSSG